MKKVWTISVVQSSIFLFRVVGPDPVLYWRLDPRTGSGMDKHPDPGIPDLIFVNTASVFRVKKYLYSSMRTRDLVNPRSEVGKSDPVKKNPGSATLQS
jgi:hypothetical protein